MATIQNPQQQNEDLANPGNPVNQPGATSGTSGGVGTSQGGGAAAPNQGPVSPVQSSPNGQNPSGYTDVATYLNANQNNQAANNLGSQVAGNLTNAYNSTMGDINTSAAQQQNAINSGYTPENTSLIQQVENNPNAVAYNTPTPAAQDNTGFLNAGNSLAFIPATGSTSTTPALNQNNITAFQNQLNDNYTGPTTWADVTNANGTTTPGYGTLQGEVATAQQNSNINTPGMANVLTQQVEQQLNPGQTGEGINNLDTLFLTGNQNNVNQVQAAAQPFAGLTNYLNTQNTNLGNDVTNAQTNAANTAATAQGALTGTNGALTNLNSAITGATNTDLANAQSQQTQLANDLQNLETAGSIIPQGAGIQDYNVGQLSAADQAALGLTGAQAQTLEQALQNAGTSQYESAPNFGYWSPTQQINLDQYLTQQNPTTGITAGTVATPQQYQEMAAINALEGANAPLQSEAINPNMASEAGTYNPQNYDQFNYQAALQAAQNAATTNQTAAQQQANQASAAALAQHNASKGGFLNTVENVAPFIANPTLALGASTLPKSLPAIAFGGDINSYLDKEGK